MVAQPGNGTSTASSGQPRNTIVVKNPATGEVVREVGVDSPEAVRAAMERVRRASAGWAATPIRERCSVVRKAADIIASRMDEIAKVVKDETGKASMEALLHDLGPSLMVMRYFCTEAPRILSPEKIHLAFAKHRRSYLSYQPKGVIAVITPWNFPFFMPAADVSMALISGSGVILKPSEITPGSAIVLKECFDQAGLNPDLFQLVNGYGETGAAVIDAMPDHVVFTGSVPTGRKIGIACAERFITYTLELGGKAPLLALEDADLERTSNAIVWGGFANAGQICAGVERVYAVSSIYDALTEQVAEKTRRLRVGAPGGDEVVDVGAICFRPQLEVARTLVDDAVQKGAKLLVGGGRPEGVPEQGMYFSPTVLSDCTHEMRVMREEIFGPVVPLMRVQNQAEAVQLANESHLGLGAYVFTQDVAKGRRVGEQIRVGSVMINDVLAHAGLPEMPWGGVKQSGLGVVRSERGLKELCHARHINEPALSTWPARDPYWFPYSRSVEQATLSWMKRILGAGPMGRILGKLL